MEAKLDHLPQTPMHLSQTLMAQQRVSLSASKLLRTIGASASASGKQSPKLPLHSNQSLLAQITSEFQLLETLTLQCLMNTTNFLPMPVFEASKIVDKVIGEMKLMMLLMQRLHLSGPVPGVLLLDPNTEKLMSPSMLENLAGNRPYCSFSES